MLFLFLSYLTSSVCPDNLIPTHSRELIRGFSNLKSGSPMNVYGHTTIPFITNVSSFAQLNAVGLDYAVGFFYSQMFIFIFAIISLIVTIVCTVMMCAFCQPSRSRKPGACIITGWIIFSLFYLVSLAYYIISMIEMPKFYDNFPGIPGIILNAADDIVSSYYNFTSLYYSVTNQLYQGENGAFVAPALLVYNNTWRSTIISQTLESLVNVTDEIDAINDIIFTSNCTFANLTEPLTLTASDQILEVINVVDNLTAELDSISGADLLENETITPLMEFGNNVSQILNGFIGFPLNSPWVNVPTIVENYADLEVAPIIPSFNTKNSEYTALLAFEYIIFVIILACFVLQTISVFSRNQFSRTFAMINNPLSIFLTILVGALGICATVIACSISDLCDLSSSFAANFYSGKPVFQEFGLPPLNASLFEDDNRSIFGYLGFEDTIQFSTDLLLQDINETIDMPVIDNFFNLQTVVDSLNQLPQLNQIADQLSSFLTQSSTIRRAITETNCGLEVLDNITDLMNRAHSLYFAVLYEIPLITTAASSLLTYDAAQSYDNFSTSFTTTGFEELFTDGTLLGAELLTCPLRTTKRTFCSQTGGAFGSWAIFSHFYMISLVGFTLLLFVRRKDMLSADFENEPRPSKKSKGAEPTHQRRNVIWSQNYIVSDSGDKSLESSDSSSSDSFDMFQQSRAGVV